MFLPAVPLVGDVSPVAGQPRARDRRTATHGENNQTEQRGEAECSTVKETGMTPGIRTIGLAPVTVVSKKYVYQLRIGRLILPIL